MMKITKITVYWISLLFVCQLNIFSQWEVEYDPYLTNPYYISVVDTGTIWCLGYKTAWWDTVEVMTKTPEYGWQWGNGNDLPVNVQYFGIAGINSTTAFIGDIQGHIYKTTNYGWNWINILNAGSNYRVVDIKFSKVNKNSGYIFCCRNDYTSGVAKIYKTNDYGNTWQLFTPNFGNYDFANKPSVWVTDSLHAWIALWCQYPNCPSIKIAYTTNGGITWLTSDVESQRTGVQAIVFSYNNLIGLSSSYKAWTPNKIFKTNNGGNNWNFSDTILTGNILSLITIPNSSVFYMSGVGLYPDTTWKPYILKSSNNGINWISMTYQDSLNSINDMDAINLNGKIYAYATITGKVMKLVDTAVVIGIENEGNIIPQEFELNQNYPNPFNPTTNINFSIPKAGYTSIRIYDIMGRLVHTLFEEQLAPGSYKAEWNASQMPSGIYIYRIESGSFTESRKMILVK